MSGRAGPRKRPEPLEPQPDAVTLKRVAVAVEWLREFLDRDQLALASTVYQYALENMVGEGLDPFDDHWACCPPLSTLVQHPRMPLAPSALRNLLRIGKQVAELEADLGMEVVGELTVAHHRELFSVTDPARKRELAALAVSEQWSVPDLAAAVAYSRKAPAESVTEAAAGCQVHQHVDPEVGLDLGAREELARALASLGARVGVMRTSLHNRPRKDGAGRS